LLSTLGGYSVGKVIDPIVDKVLGRDNEKKIQAVERHLQAQVDKGTANQKQVEEQLAVARRELEIIRQLLAGKTTQTQVAKYRAELSSDMKMIRKMVEEHERRLAEHDRLLAEQGKLIEDQGLELKDLRQRLDHQQPWSPPGAPAPPRSGPPPVGPPSSSAAGLKIEVRGEANLIRLREATHPVLMGKFRFSGSRSQAAYFLPPQTHVVVELFAPDNRISMPAQLANQVQIVSHGWHYETLVY